MNQGFQAELKSCSDEGLMAELCTAEDRAACDTAFNEVFARYNQRVVAWCYRVTKDHELATDLAQEVFLKAYRHRASFRGDSRLSTWLYSIARNHCLSSIKRRAEDTVSLDHVTHRALRDESNTAPCTAAERSDMVRRMLRLMNRTLEPLEVRVMTLHYGHEIPLAVITRQLALTNPSGAKAYIVNAGRKLSGVARRRGWEVALADPEARPDYWRTEVAA